MLCAPSLAGESFGMVLTEAFAAGTPAIASAIAGYSDVVSDGVDGVLVPPGDPQRLAEELQRAHHEPERLSAMGEAARQSAQRYAWPRVADQRHRGLRAGDRGARAGHDRRAGCPLGRVPPCRRGPAASAAESCPRSTRRWPRAATGAAASRAAPGSASPGRWGSASPRSPRRRSASTTSSPASFAPTSPGSWSPAPDGASRSSSAPPPGTGSRGRRCPTGRFAAATSPRRR